jgi:hypothetical protein
MKICFVFTENIARNAMIIFHKISKGKTYLYSTIFNLTIQVSKNLCLVMNHI